MSQQTDCTQTDASCAVRSELEVRRTLTDVSPRTVDTRAVETVVWVQTLVDVRTVTSGPVDLVASVTLTAIQPDQVDAATVHAQVAKYATLVYV